MYKWLYILILSTSNQRYLLEYFSMVSKDYLPVKGHFLSSSFPFFPLASPGTLHFSHQYLIIKYILRIFNSTRQLQVSQGTSKCLHQSIFFHQSGPCNLYSKLGEFGSKWGIYTGRMNIKLGLLWANRSI